jgi:Glycosyl transferases group 1
MVGDFLDRFRDFDLIVMSTYNFLHPDVLSRELKKPIKVLGFIDDPYSTYLKGIPYLWAFDGAFYISPSYNECGLFEEALQKWGCRNHAWWPMVPFAFEQPPDTSDEFFRRRDVDMIYVGNAVGTKVDRLIRLKEHFGRRFHVYGRWPFKGYFGIARGLFGKPIYGKRVRSLEVRERTAFYWRSRIGFNMHVSEQPTETGNMRMYEVAAHGAMLLCDKGGRDAHAQIFMPGKEAVYYDSLEDAVEKAEYYLAHEEERLAIAKAGFERYWQSYEWKSNLKGFLDWAVSIPHRET